MVGELPKPGSSEYLGPRALTASGEASLDFGNALPFKIRLGELPHKTLGRPPLLQRDLYLIPVPHPRVFLSLVRGCCTRAPPLEERGQLCERRY